MAYISGWNPCVDCDRPCKTNVTTEGIVVEQVRDGSRVWIVLLFPDTVLLGDSHPELGKGVDDTKQQRYCSSCSALYTRRGKARVIIKAEMLTKSNK